MTRLKPACDELTSASAANNMASMQAIDEAVFEFVKDYGKGLTKSIGNKDNVPPPGPDIPHAKVIVRLILLPLNELSQC